MAIGPWKSASAPVSTDTVLPLPFFDDTPLWKAFILYSMFVFDGVLDPPKLRTGLEALAKRDGFRKLGARLRRNKSGALEYHIPAEFTAERPAITYSHVQHSTTAAEHAVAGKIPKPSAQPAVVGDPDELRPLFQPAGGPTKLDDFLSADIPQMGLHVVSFTDQTLVSIYWPHTLMDAMGKKAVLESWMLELQGRGAEIVTPHGAERDALAELGTHPTEPHGLEDRRLSMLGLAGYGLGNIADFAIRTHENRMVCVPGAFIKRLHESATADLAAAGIGPDDHVPFLSEGDVLTAWWTRIAVEATLPMPRSAQRTVVLNNAMSLRSALSEDLLQPGRAYVSNAIGFINVVVPAGDIVEKPLGLLAGQIRRAIRTLGTRAQVEAFTSMWRTSSGRVPPFFGNSSMHMITFSNWCKARLFDVDFSAARVAPTDSTAKSGRPVYIQNNQFGLILPNGFPTIGRDTLGNYWLSGYMNKGVWPKIEAALARASAT